MSNLQNARVRSLIMGVICACKACEHGECPEYCAEMVRAELDEIIDSVCKEATDTLEQRNQQLAEVVREMWNYVVNDYNCRPGFPGVDMSSFEQPLEELGIDVWDR